MLLPKKPVQGIWGLVEKMLEKYGALNKKYDSNLDGVIDNADKVDGYDAGTGANQVLVLNSAGQVPLGNLPLLPASQLDFSFAWELVGSLSSSGTSAAKFLGLSSDDKIYMVLGNVINPNTASSKIYIYTPSYNASLGQCDAAVTYQQVGYCWWSNNNGTTSTITQALDSTSGSLAIPIANIPPSEGVFFMSIVQAEPFYDGTYYYSRILSYAIGNYSIYLSSGIYRLYSDEVCGVYCISDGASLNWNIHLFKPKW